MAKKKVPRKRRGAPQPKIYKEIGVERAREIIGFRHAPLYFVLGGARHVHPNADDSSTNVSRIVGNHWMNQAARYSDMSVPSNRLHWEGELRETALTFAIRDWKNQPGRRTRHNPRFYEIDVEMMLKQAQWAGGS